MSATQFDTPDTGIDVPDDLTSAESKLVYLFLTATDGASIDELHDALDIRKISLFPVLRTLTERDVIAREGAIYVPSAS
ncbi:TrmB family transcriptional regulator [Haloplanus aerogenes]|nr:TrmB family transcriptional regulator [Haloplanus aerogenes]AZH23878.1 TrmB family transcriptional regulator [Haloplanus aerogenes]